MSDGIQLLFKKKISCLWCVGASFFLRVFRSTKLLLLLPGMCILKSLGRNLTIFALLPKIFRTKLILTLCFKVWLSVWNWTKWWVFFFFCWHFECPLTQDYFHLYPRFLFFSSTSTLSPPTTHHTKRYDMAHLITFLFSCYIYRFRAKSMLFQ